MNRKKFLIILFMVAIFLLPLYAYAATSLIINIKTKDNLLQADLENRTLVIWKLNPDFIDTSMDRTKLISILEGFTNEDMDRQLQDSNYKWILNPKKEDDYKLKLDNLSFGLYYLREINADKRSHYLLPIIFSPKETNIVNLKWDTRPKEPKVPPNTPPSPNLPPNTVELIKTNEEGDVLSGAKFRLYFSSGEPVKTKNFKFDNNGENEIFETDKDGKILIGNLKPGLYFFKEISAPYGYEILENEVYFTIFDAKATSLNIKNKKKKGKIHFFKSDERGKPLLGAEFIITKLVDGKYVRIQKDNKDIVLTSDEDGKFEIDALDYGTYYIWEIKAPQSYNLLNGAIKFEINDESFEKIIYIKNNKRPPIPKTGDITLIILLISGSIMLVLGLYLIKDNKN